MGAQTETLWQFMIFGNTVLGYLITFIIFAAGMLAIKLVIRKLVKRIKLFSEKTVSTVDDFLAGLLETIALPFLYFVVVYLAIKSLGLPEPVKKALNYGMLAVLVYFAVKAILASINYGLKVYLGKQDNDMAVEKSLQGIMLLVKLAIWGGGVIFFLDNMGFKVSAVITGLGIGGVAVALAAQTVLKDLFSYFCILFDHPFKVGDFVIVGDFMGNIEHIGIKTTRVRSLGGEMLVFSNSDLTDTRLRNYQLMQKRRVVFKIGVVYQTPQDQVQEIPNVLKKIITGIGETAFDRAHFYSFGDSSLVFEIVYYVIGSDYNKYMDIQQKINFAIMTEFAKRRIEFAYPTQTIYYSQTSS